MKTRSPSKGVGLKTSLRHWEGLKEDKPHPPKKQKNRKGERRGSFDRSSEISQACEDGRILGIVARTRLKPAHDTLTKVYAGLLFHHILSGARDFKENFHFWNRSL